jgi:hypothetical protein
VYPAQFDIVKDVVRNRIDKLTPMSDEEIQTFLAEYPNKITFSERFRTTSCPVARYLNKDLPKGWEVSVSYTTADLEHRTSAGLGPELAVFSLPSSVYKAIRAYDKALVINPKENDE